MNDALNAIWVKLAGLLVAGHRVAASPSPDYPFGTLVKQFPIFQQLGLDLAGFFPGTLNLSIQPLTWSMARPDLTFHQVQWTDLHPPEDFSFAACRLLWEKTWHPGWIYFPHPETKVRHFQDANVLEIISPPLQGIRYGDCIDLELNARAVRLIQPGGGA